MPKYTFECPTCTLRFDRTLAMGEHPTHACPSCKEEAPRLFAGNGFGFAFASGGTAPANSGVHDQDYPTADKIVGRSAETRWTTYNERDEVKKKVRKNNGTGALSRVDGDGHVDYFAMPAAVKAKHDKLVDQVVAATAASKKAAIASKKAAG